MVDTKIIDARIFSATPKFRLEIIQGLFGIHTKLNFIHFYKTWKFFWLPVGNFIYIGLINYQQIKN